ncbi:MAG: glycosyltransferase family 4 protein [Gammaproteobacteria bacterium]|nr:glycosyltransferase family 4 protein [Pseudomonadales bacterium]MCP5346142.1 glycosyltransferase family 4 protein [Pseudomonadales bacterium]
MKVLLTTPYEIWPANYGGAVRTVAIARALERAGHAVALLSANRSVPGFQSYRGFTTAGYFFNPFFVNELDRVIRGFCPDFIVAAFPYQAAMLIPIASRHRVPLVYDAHNIETLRFARMNKPLQRRIVAFFEKRMLQNSSAVLCVSEAEADYVRTHFKTPIALLPNGVDIQAAKPVTERDYEFCFFGALDYQPNLVALEFLRDQWSRIRALHPSARLLLVGRNPPDWSDAIDGWVVAGEVASVAKAISKAAILLCPLSEGGGSRLKIIEAIANGLLVVSTRFGAEGFESLEEEESIVITTLEEFVDAAVTRSLSPIDHPAIAATARRFDWNCLVEEIVTLGSVLKQKTPYSA